MGTSSTETAAVRRIHVIGGPGSGKTTLARRLSNRLDAPMFDLDEIAYVGGAGPKRSLAERLSDISAIQSQPAWITEGIYLFWVDGLLQSADAIVWLDVPWRVAAWRIVVRHVRASLEGTNRHPGLGKLLRFLNAAHRYYVDPSLRLPEAADDEEVISRAHAARQLAAYDGKVVRCSSSGEVTEFVRRLESSRGRNT